MCLLVCRVASGRPFVSLNYDFILTVFLQARTTRLQGQDRIPPGRRFTRVKVTYVSSPFFESKILPFYIFFPPNTVTNSQWCVGLVKMTSSLTRLCLAGVTFLCFRLGLKKYIK